VHAHMYAVLYTYIDDKDACMYVYTYEGVCARTQRASEWWGLTREIICICICICICIFICICICI